MLATAPQALADSAAKSAAPAGPSAQNIPARAEAVAPAPPKNAFGVFKSIAKRGKASSMFGDGFTVNPSFGGEIVDVADSDPAPAQAGDAAQAAPQPAAGAEWSANAAGGSAPSANTPVDLEKRARLKYVSSDPNDDPIQAPGNVGPVRINPDAPASFKGIVMAQRSGDRELADQYADDFVRYQQNFIFEVRDYTQIIGEALIRQKVINDENWVGVEQYIDYQFAKAREDEKALFKPTHELALKRIRPDTQGKVEVYYFFSLDSHWCRFMAPDVERLYRSLKNDPNVKMVALTIGETPEEWLTNYREYTGMTMPIYSGAEMAKAMNIGFVPAVIVVAPTENRAYRKTGQQSFSRLYELVRAVQGLPMQLTPEIEAINDTPIGQVETEHAAKEGRGGKPTAIVSKSVPPKEKMERF